MNRILNYRKLVALSLVLLGSHIMLAQEISLNDEIYNVKEGAIFKEGVDVTGTLKPEQKDMILNQAKEKREALERAKYFKEAEKREKKLHKRRKRAEKTLERSAKLQANFKKADKKYNKHLAKYDKLNAKGNLTPEEAAALKLKIEKLKAKQEKAKRKLK